ncbi:methionine adenosyltransferase [Eubacterium callanderi]|jgi:S-adenosylmethionine synthetase|uniref:methionine adenosyltransferase n=1 Tax=Eubacterium callanderi TaxID=53442 RepID=UPI001C0FFCBE|nr:methionine adenosyltransferase [Eubacterium callanderi]MBU5304662.1 methionine adenosyltransferase [Eubacterium callanderi]
MSKRYLTAESVCAGHPDKLCDIIADNILDECLRRDKASRVACEVMATKGKIIVAGEISCSEKIDIRSIVKNVLKELGYNPLKFLIYVYVHNQSSDIAAGVNTALEARNGINEQYGSIGAGDQGTMYGYATKETREMLPLPLVLSHRIVKRLDEARKGKLIKGILPDGKAQVTIEYNDDVPVRVKTIVVSVQHEKNKTQEELKSDILNNVLWQCFEDFPFDDETEILINPSGQFVLGGPAADTGLTGRKIMVDTYGGLASHGGGALCGKDPTKVDRSGAYMARYIAKHIVWCDLAEKCEVAISYAIGKANPVAFSINTFGTGTVSDEVLTIAAQEVFNLRPAAIIEKLRLRNIHYSDTAVYGHFNSCLFPWEDVNKYSELKEAVEKYAD